MATTEIYLIRHGESQANRHCLFLGHGDMDLTELGRQQAKLAAGYLRAIHADAIYASDLQRAYHTAQATAEILGLPITVDQRLREIDGGAWEFRPFTELVREYPAEYDLWQHNIGLARCVGGESTLELQKRIVAAVTDLARQHEGQSIFIFTHATPIRVLRAACEGRTPAEIQSIPWATNASVTYARLENDHLTLVDYSTDHFMGGLVTALPDSV